MVTSDDFGEVVGVLRERPHTGEFSLLDAVRVEAAAAMLAKSGFSLVLLPAGAAAPIVRRRRRWWRSEWRER
jgi:hypothetical protein